MCGEDHVGIPFDTVDESDIASMRKQAEERKAAGVAAPGEDRPLYIPDLNTPRKLEIVAEALMKRGHSTAVVEKVLGLNFRRAFGEIWATKS